MPIRPLSPDDLAPLARLIDRTGLFPGEMLAGMAEPCLSGAAGDDRWLVLDDAGLAGLAYVVRERLTEGTWNLLLIAVDPDRHRQGHGSALLARIEREIAAEGARLLLVETSGMPGFAGQWAFYRGNGFAEEARIRDFYQAGDDKLVFTKRLGTAAPR